MESVSSCSRIRPEMLELVTETSRRHDSVLTFVFLWASACSMCLGPTLADISSLHSIFEDTCKYDYI